MKKIAYLFCITSMMPSCHAMEKMEQKIDFSIVWNNQIAQENIKERVSFLESYYLTEKINLKNDLYFLYIKDKPTEKKYVIQNEIDDSTIEQLKKLQKNGTKKNPLILINPSITSCRCIAKHQNELPNLCPILLTKSEHSFKFSQFNLPELTYTHKMQPSHTINTLSIVPYAEFTYKFHFKDSNYQSDDLKGAIDYILAIPEISSITTEAELQCFQNAVEETSDSNNNNDQQCQQNVENKQQILVLNSPKYNEPLTTAKQLFLPEDYQHSFYDSSNHFLRSIGRPNEIIPSPSNYKYIYITQPELIFFTMSELSISSENHIVILHNPSNKDISSILNYSVDQGRYGFPLNHLKFIILQDVHFLNTPSIKHNIPIIIYKKSIDLGNDDADCIKYNYQLDNKNYESTNLKQVIDHVSENSPPTKYEQPQSVNPHKETIKNKQQSSSLSWKQTASGLLVLTAILGVLHKTGLLEKVLKQINAAYNLFFVAHLS
jgi:hypothetical protein